MKRFTLVSVMLIAVMGFSGQALAADPVVRLGEALYKDLNLSVNSNQSCMTCHHPLSGFADTANHVDPLGSPVSDGSDPIFFGGRNAPSAAYAGFSPPLNCVNDPVDGLFCTGGVFWDGRATGLADTDTGIIEVGGKITGPTFDPLADQAKGPFQNPVEMALYPEDVIDIVLQSDYTKLFKQAFGYKVETFAETNAHIVYNDIALAIAAFERSKELNKFSSKFDQLAKEQAKKGIDVSTIALDEAGVVVDEFGTPVKSKVFMQEELEGLALFNMPNDNKGDLGFWGDKTIVEGGNCAACHPSGPITEPTDSQGKTLFTDFSYDNLGVPRNRTIANLAGERQPTDKGLFTTLTELLGYSRKEVRGTKGLFKVPTLRNVAQTAPYTHNGFFPTLYSIVHFYNTRIAEPLRGPEVGLPNEDELGNLGLSKDQEEKIVLFMETLTDR